jgi:hypothetical protein
VIAVDASVGIRLSPRPGFGHERFHGPANSAPAGSTASVTGDWPRASMSARASGIQS